MLSGVVSIFTPDRNADVYRAGRKGAEGVSRAFRTSSTTDAQYGTEMIAHTAFYQ